MISGTTNKTETKKMKRENITKKSRRSDPKKEDPKRSRDVTNLQNNKEISLDNKKEQGK